MEMKRGKMGDKEMKRSRKNSVVRSEGKVEHTAEKVRKLNRVRGNYCVVKLTVF